MEVLKKDYDRLDDVDSLAKFLNVHKSKIYTFTRQGKIPMIRVGKYCRFNRTEVLEWLKSQQRTA